MADLASHVVDRLRDNLAQVRERIAEAAKRSGKGGDEVRLVGVTKYVSSSIARQLFQEGLTDLGESRPQELWEKAAALSDVPAHWHLIGHLQRNKIRRSLPLIALVHSVDSLRLLKALDEEARSLGRAVDVLLEVNISGDAAKHGFAPQELAGVLPHAAILSSLRVRGLMAMAALEGGIDAARRDFAALRELRDQCAKDCPPTIELRELSMGMSDDYAAAIEEGATIVRVGSVLFEGIAE